MPAHPRPVSVADVVSAVDARVPFSKAGGWDPVGLQLGDPAASVESVAVCHEVTRHIVDMVNAENIDLLVSYHPLLFAPTTRIVSGRGPAGRAADLLRHQVSLLVVHTAFDVAPGGVADALADALGLGDVTAFGPSYGTDTVKVVTFVPQEERDTVVAAMAAAGAGTIGHYRDAAFTVVGEGSFTASAAATPVVGEPGQHTTSSEIRVEMVASARSVDRVVGALVAAHPYEEPAYDVFDHRGNAGFIGRRGTMSTPIDLGRFGAFVADQLDAAPRIAGDPSRPVSGVSVIPGSGRSHLSAAEPTDVIVTGDIGHHDARAATDRGQAIVDPGHAPTERPGVARLYSLVHEVATAFGQVVVHDLTKTDSDPWSHAWRR